MKWYLKIILFFTILFIMIQALAILFIPNPSNLNQFNYYEKGKYELLDEKNDTVDTIFLGDSLIYSSIIPMHIWNEYGFTSFDCSLPSQTLDYARDYLNIAVESQHPKVVMMESDVIFRKLKSKTKTKNKIISYKNWVPLLKFHNNWKQFGPGGFINYYKGYRINVTEVPVKDFKSTKNTKKYKKIKSENLKLFNEIVNICKKNNIKLILIDIPNQKSWSYVRHNAVEKLAKDNEIDFIDLNLEKVNIDWNKDTKDGGEHLNFNGAKKVSSFIGNYMSKLNMLKDHREDEKYNSWHKSYELYIEKSIDEANN